MAQSKITSFFGGGKKPAIKEENNTAPVESKSDPEDTKINNGSTSPKRKADQTSQIEEKPSKKAKMESKGLGILTSDPKFPDREPIYGPVLDAWWPEGSSVPYVHLSRTYQELEKHTKRTTILELLTLMFLPVLKYSPDDLLSVFYLCVHKVAPVWEGVELGVGDSILFSAIAEVTGRSTAVLKKDLVALGDLGDVAQKSRSHQKTVFTPKPLSVPQVFSAMKEIAFMKGNSSQKQKKDKMKGLLSSCREEEAKFIFRTLSGKLRIRMLERTLIAALANALYYTQNAGAFQQFRAIVSQGKAEEIMEVIEIDDDERAIKPKKAKVSKAVAKENEELKEKLRWAQEILRVVFNEMPCYDDIIPLLLEKKLSELEGKSFLKPGFPLKPMLANRADSILEVQKRFGDNEFILEYKYDGERAQIHRTADGSIKIFSRACEDHTKKFPDVLLMLPEMLLKPDTTFIIDCEIVAIKEDEPIEPPQPGLGEQKSPSGTFKILPFQLLSTRARKEVKLEDIKVRVALFAFDILYLNGESLIKLQLHERQEKLLENFKIVTGKFQLVESISSKNHTVEEMSNFLKAAINENCEGLMCKILVTNESDYQLSKRSNSWLKVKKDFAGMVDSLDLVVIGGYYGRGKRVGTYGSYLLAVYDNDNDTFQAITKCMTGFTDEFLSSTAQFFENHKLVTPPTYYLFSPSQAPDVWFEPVQVWEIQFADFSISPVHKAAIGLVDEDKGISVRFPRYIRSRDDKTPENATTAEEIAEMYHRQNSKVVNSMGSSNRSAVNIDD